MNPPTDQSLKQALAKMLPEKIEVHEQSSGITPCFTFWHKDGQGRQILDTELLQICWEIEDTLNMEQSFNYIDILIHNLIKENYKSGRNASIHATWQQRTIALAQVKGIEII